MSAEPVTIAELTAAHGQALVDLFQRSGSNCFCRFWHFSGDRNAWLDRCFNDPSRNCAELLQSLAERNDESRALVASTIENVVVGYMKLVPAPALAKLYASRPYRGMAAIGADRPDTFVIGCMLVDPSVRRSGVARALVAAAPAFVQRWGGTQIEAFPYEASDPTPELMWTGPLATLLELGYSEVARVGPYPVLRRTLR